MPGNHEGQHVSPIAVCCYISNAAEVVVVVVDDNYDNRREFKQQEKTKTMNWKRKTFRYLDMRLSCFTSE